MSSWVRDWEVIHVLAWLRGHIILFWDIIIIISLVWAIISALRVHINLVSSPYRPGWDVILAWLRDFIRLVENQFDWEGVYWELILAWLRVHIGLVESPYGPDWESILGWLRVNTGLIESLYWAGWESILAWLRVHTGLVESPYWHVWSNRFRGGW